MGNIALTTSASRRSTSPCGSALVGVLLAGIGRNLNGNLIPVKDPTLGMSLAHEQL